MASARVNATELAAILGVTERAIWARTESGALSQPGPDRLWDREEAVREWREGTRPGRKRGPRGPRKAGGNPQPGPSGDAPVPPSPPDDVSPEDVARATGLVSEVMSQHGEPATVVKLGHAKRVQAIMKAARDVLEVQRLKGESASLAEVEKAVSAFHRELRQMILDMPASESETLAEVVAQDAGVRAVRRELERIARGLCERASARAFRMAE